MVPAWSAGSEVNGVTQAASRAFTPFLAPARALLAPHARRWGWTRRGVAVAVALAIVYTVWGSTYLAIAVAVESAPPMLMMAVRFLLAGGVLFAVAERRGDRVGDRVTLRHVGHGVVTGGVLLVGGTGMLTLAQTSIESGLAALIASTVPLFLALFARGAFGERLSGRAWIGLGLGLIGIGILVSPGPGSGPGVVFALIGAAAWAGGSLRSRVARGPRRPMVAASLEMLGGALVFAVVGVLSGELDTLDLDAISLSAWIAFGYLIIAGSLVAHTSYSWLLRTTSTTVVGTYAYVNPVVAVVLGWLFLGEALSPRMLLAGGIVLCSVVLLISGRPGEPVPAQLTSGADVFVGVSRWRRIGARLGALPRPARLYRDPGVLSPDDGVGVDGSGVRARG